MRLYTFHLFAGGADRAPGSSEEVSCASDAGALEYACKLLARLRDFEAVEVWNGGARLFRLGGGRPWDGLQLKPRSYVGRWDRKSA